MKRSQLNSGVSALEYETDMILAIDTSTARLGIAVFNGTEVLAENCWTSPNRHTVSLAPAVDEMLRELEIEKKKLKAVGVALGPGSFTSLRVGLSFAKGMSLGLGIPVIGVPTLDVAAGQQPVCDLPLCAFLQAGRGKLAVTFYEAKRGRWNSSGEITVYTAETLSEVITQPTVLTGEFDADTRAVFRKNKNIKMSSPASSLRRAGYLAEAAWKIYEKGEFPQVSSLSPLYLHTHDPILK
ncbi:MAG: tRNA (adenosine(37)-N6)-threonylcarbamoyltransferase complex dimerization subunit type 1 TsaB [Anaerolineaceae bacterium]|nr:tRNA (adenosine(37)-N6)-threonylcarbamoyltransferase complex dimerization subunit type 1 TsaB [Anaerolineaceae bacterium]